MKRIVIVALALSQLLFWGQPARADYPCPGMNSIMVPLGKETLTVSNTAVSLTPPTTGTLQFASIWVETNPIRFWDDGSVPTASTGTPVAANSGINVCGAAISTFKAIRTGADATLTIRYYGVR